MLECMQISKPICSGCLYNRQCWKTWWSKGWLPLALWPVPTRPDQTRAVPDRHHLWKVLVSIYWGFGDCTGDSFVLKVYRCGSGRLGLHDRKKKIWISYDLLCPANFYKYHFPHTLTCVCACVCLMWVLK